MREIETQSESGRERESMKERVIERRNEIEIQVKREQEKKKRDRVREIVCTIFQCMPTSITPFQHRSIQLPSTCYIPFYNYKFHLVSSCSLLLSVS